MTRSPLRIALVTAFPPGGQSLNEYGLHLARGLAENPDVAEVIVIADAAAGAPVVEYLGPRITVHRVWSFNSARAGIAILRSLRRARADGVVWNLQTASFGDREIPAALGLLAPLAARWLLGAKNGIIAHNIISGVDLEVTNLRGQRLRQAIVRAGGAFVTRAMLASGYMTVTLRGYLDQLLARRPGADVALVPHGTFDTAARLCLPLTDRPLRIVTMGKFGTYKRLETLLAAFDLLRSDSRFATAQLLIGGTDHPATPGYLNRLQAERQNDPGVHFAGYIAEEEIPAFFGSARLSVFDYVATTGSSGVLHQTASYGTVPVFPQIGDFVDLCRDEGLSGAHYAPEDARGLADAMAAMLPGQDAAQSIADSNRRAALGMPFSDVVAYHVARFRSAAKAPAPAAASRVSASDA